MRNWHVNLFCASKYLYHMNLVVHYLWGIDTFFSIDFTHNSSLYITYEELTLKVGGIKAHSNLCCTLPMRNWHSLAFSFSIPTRSLLYITYEELTQKILVQSLQLNNVVHYLWGIDTLLIIDNIFKFLLKLLSCTLPMRNWHLCLWIFKIHQIIIRCTLPMRNWHIINNF